MRLLVIQHDDDKGLGLLEGPLRDAGAELEIRFAGREPLAIAGHAAVIALPGIANPEDETEAIAVTRSSLGEALDRNLPTLGICLGAELLAEAADAKTAPCPAEWGYRPVSLTADGAADPLLAGLPSPFEAFQAHGFVAALPDGAVALAHSEFALQGFRLRDHVWGLQYHPEASEQMITEWLRTIGHVMERGGAHLPHIAEQARRHASISKERARQLAHRFVDVVRSAGADSS